MANSLYIPILNPIKFVEVSPSLAGQYNYHHLDDWAFIDQLYEFQEHKTYQQIFQSNDIIKLQFESNYDPLQLAVIDCNGTSFISLNANQVRMNKYQPGYFVYEVSISLNSLPADRIYYITLQASDKSMISEPILVSAIFKNSLLLEYSNTHYHGDVVFETGIVFSLRVPGFLDFQTPGSKDVVYEDQVLNETLLSGRPYRLWKFFVGEGGGVPPWLIDKINYAFCCNTISIDGKSFAKSEGTKWTAYEDVNNPLRGYSIDLREGLNRSSKIVTSTGDPNKKVSLVYNIDGRVFGDVSSNAGSNVIKILSAE